MKDKLDKFLGYNLNDEDFNNLQTALDFAEINTKLRVCHFLAQCAHESNMFKTKVENLNYSAEGLLKTFPKYFNSSNVAAYARKPELIANRVYANRMQNGNEASGDGFKYRGRGVIQLTGKENYTNFSIATNTDCVNNPDLVSTEYAYLAAAWFWKVRKLNIYADKDDLMQVTKLINGGTIGLPHRKELLQKAKLLF